MVMPRVWTIVTPENVPLELELANPLERGVALIIDTLITAAVTVPIAAILTALSGDRSGRQSCQFGFA
jgi:uncharacterized RDD family membrane protein YckC